MSVTTLLHLHDHISSGREKNKISLFPLYYVGVEKKNKTEHCTLYFYHCESTHTPGAF